MSHPTAIVSTRRNIGHSKPLPVLLSLDQPGRLRVGHLQTLYSISHTTLYQRLAIGAIPKPDGYDGARPYWNTATIRRSLMQD
jgi:hypothetical protein